MQKRIIILSMNLKEIKNRLIAKKDLIHEIVFPILSFLVPFLILICVFSISGFSLSGNVGRTTIMFDMQSQYICYLRDFRNVLLNNENFYYSLHRTFGGDYISIYTYYLSSPLNLLIVFISENDLPLFFLWSNIIKMSLAGLCFYFLLRFSLHKVKFSYIGFAIAYALNSFFLVEMHNFMWLDAVMMLPIIILGIKLIEEDKHLYIYPLALGFALMTSWYIGALICMFLIIFGIYRIICLNNKKERLSFLIRFSLLSLAGGLLASSYWFTSLVHLFGTKATGGIPTESIFFSISLFFTGFLTNNFQHTSVIAVNSGYITMFTSVITLVLIQLYFFNKGYSLKERLSTLGMFVLFFFIVQSNQLNAIFHGGQEPTWFPGRYSFIIAFFVVYFASLEFEKIKETYIYSVALPIASMFFVLLIVGNVENPITINAGGELYKGNALGILLYVLAISIITGYLILDQKLKKSNWIVELALAVLIVTLTGISSSDGAHQVISKFVEKNNGQDYMTYLSDCKYSSGVDVLKNYDKNNLYRMEMTFNRPGNYNMIDNNPSFYSYNGLSYYSSNSKKDVTSYFNKLGFHNNGYFEKFDGGSTLSISSLLGLKYLIDQDNIEKFNKPLYLNKQPFELMDLTSTENPSFKYYENKYAIPLGFVANSMSESYVSEGEKKDGKNEVYWYDHFEYQNQIFKTLVDNILDKNNKQKDIFKKMPQIAGKMTNLISTQDEYFQEYYTSTNDANGSLRFTYMEPTDATNFNMYFYEKNGFSNANYRVDGVRFDNFNYWHSGIRGFDKIITQRHILEIDLTSPVTNTLIAPEMYYENIDVLKEYVDELKSQSPADLKLINNRFEYSFEGTINLKKENQTFYLTVPYEKDFKAYVDGKQVEINKKFNVFMGIDLSSFSLGKHTIKISYSDSCFVFGILFTGLGITTLVVTIVLEKKTKNKKKFS